MSNADEITLSDLARVRLGPSDTLLVRSEYQLTREHAQAIRDRVRDVFPGVPCLVLGAGLEVAVIEGDPGPVPS